MYKNWQLLSLFCGVWATKDGSITLIVCLMLNITFFYMNYGIQKHDK